ncbi:methyltransferase family protein [Marinobacter sp.]|uniref:methyltransferase family protein n=1 Tax=Marinobacter sp. TaxID=50741 RepID=UPI003A906943
MTKYLLGLYALTAYCIGFASLLALMAFLLNLAPWGIDRGAVADELIAILADTLLLTVYFALHSVMARPAFKARWTRLIPPVLERSTYVLISGLTLAVVITLWQPLPWPLWQAGPEWLRGLIYGLHGAGWVIMVLATFHISHFDFFGLGPVWRRIRDRPARDAPFSTRYLYGVVRHPISLGWLVVFWTTPDVTLGHALIAALATTYILAITPVEERDLGQAIGPAYQDYRRQVPAFIPWLRLLVGRPGARQNRS